jgi:hypothetical protein
MSDDIILAKDIDDCSNCPLYEHDCSGGWTSGGGGIPIEPPCCSWNGEEEIYEGMYEYNTYEPTEAELKWEREYIAQKEKKQKEKREAEYKEECRQRVNKISRYGNAKIKDSGEICSYWYCPNCNRWFGAWHESWVGGVGETSCTRCGERLAHSYELDD